MIFRSVLDLFIILLSALIFGEHIYAQTGEDSSSVVECEFAAERGNDRIKVEMRFKGNSSGRTDVYQPMVSRLISDDRTLYAFSKSGELREEVRADKKVCMDHDPKYCYVMSVFHKPNDDILLSYYVSDVSKLPGVFVSGNSVVFEGSQVLVYPNLGKNLLFVIRRGLFLPDNGEVASLKIQHKNTLNVMLIN